MYTCRNTVNSSVIKIILNSYDIKQIGNNNRSRICQTSTSIMYHLSSLLFLIYKYNLGICKFVTRIIKNKILEYIINSKKYYTY